MIVLAVERRAEAARDHHVEHGASVRRHGSRRARSNACSIVMWMFFSLYAGDADTVIVRWSTPAAVASSAPLTLGTSAHSVTSRWSVSSRGRNHLGGAGHRRDRFRADERRRPRCRLRPAVDQARDQLHPLVGLHRLFALKAVAGHDVADPHRPMGD